MYPRVCILAFLLLIPVLILGLAQPTCSLAGQCTDSLILHETETETYQSFLDHAGVSFKSPMHNERPVVMIAAGYHCGDNTFYNSRPRNK